MALAQQLDFVHAQAGVMLGRPHFENDVGLRPQLPGISDNARSGGGIGFVGTARGHARASLDGDLEVELQQLFDNIRGRRHPSLARVHLARNGDPHLRSPE